MNAPVKEGDVFAGKYKVERVLGEGGMGIVIAATHIDLDQRVAIKFLLPHALQHQQIVDRFVREARAAAKVSSPHVAKVIDVARMENGIPYMIMEYLEGDDLEQHLLKRGPLPANEAASYILQACEAIAEAHAAGIVHRDLKPSNLFLARQRDRRVIVKVLDFGISKMMDSSTSNLTKTATAIGTPYYMSPEQLMNAKSVDARSDIWSIGVILYELLTAKRPYEADSMPEIVAKILANTPTSLRELAPDTPPDFDQVIHRCLRNRVDDRFGSVAELAIALSPFTEDGEDSVGVISRVLGYPSKAPPAMPAANTVQFGASPATPMGSRPEPMRDIRPETKVSGSAASNATPGGNFSSTQMAAERSSGALSGGGLPAKKSAAPVIAGVAVAFLLIGGLIGGGVYMKAKKTAEREHDATATTAPPPVMSMSAKPEGTTPVAGATTAVQPTPVDTTVVATNPTATATAAPSATATAATHNTHVPTIKTATPQPTQATAVPTTKPNANPFNMGIK